MENATKALVMAGGILVAIIIISTLIYASSTWKIIPESQNKVKMAQQLAAFNQQYESYNRDALYGSDIITMLNKAINNNERYDVTSKSEPMYIDISFKLISDVSQTVTTYKHYIDTNTPDEIVEISEGTVLSEGSYKLSEDKEEIADFIEKVETGKTTYGKMKYDKGEKYQECKITVAGGSEFKSRVFKCENVEYDGEGRIKSMEFVEIEVVEIEI